MPDFNFSFPKPELNIKQFIATVEAKDQDHAVFKLREYLAALCATFRYPLLPVADSSDARLVVQEFMRRSGQITEPTTYIVTIHLFVEHWLNRVLEKYCPHFDLTNYRFRQKLEICHSIGKLPKSLFNNIGKLNTLRNNVAHKLDYDLTQMDLTYEDCMPDFELTAYKPSYSPDANQHYIMNVLGIVSSVTYFALHNHCIRELGFTASPISSVEAAPTLAGNA